MARTNRLLIGIDPGETHSGVAVVDENGIQKGFHISNNLLIEIILEYKSACRWLIVVIEDMRPYRMRINDNVINTIKYIGQIEWRLGAAGVEYVLFPRWEIKQWVYNNFNEMASEEAKKKIEWIATGLEKKTEGLRLPRRKPSFVYVDDRIVEKAMKMWWKVGKPKVGQRTPFGLKTHSWQGLAMITFYIERHEPSFLQN